MTETLHWSEDESFDEKIIVATKTIMDGVSGLNTEQAIFAINMVLGFIIRDAVAEYSSEKNMRAGALMWRQSQADGLETTVRSALEEDEPPLHAD